MRRGPDFIIIGAMKCATTTLHEQLAAQPGIFMVTMKEPCFFSDDEPWSRGWSWYESLFADARPGEIRGESSTHYTKRSTHPDTIARMRESLDPGVRFVYVMRDPVSRLVSHYIHEWTQRQINVPIEKAIVKHPELIDYGCYARQLDPYIEAFGTEAILPVFFERFINAPIETLRRVARHIGYDQTISLATDRERCNESSQRLRKSAVRDAILRRPALRWLRRTFVPKSVRARIKRVWQMTERPTLSAEAVQELYDRFDPDLARLGAWFDLDLSCKRFKALARITDPEWTSAVREVAA